MFTRAVVRDQQYDTFRFTISKQFADEVFSSDA